MNKRFDEDIWITEKLATSGSYDLYIGLWPEVGEKVLIKQVNPLLPAEKKIQAEERLLKEASTLEEFWSPFFPKIYDIRKRKKDQSLYIISQFFEGISLEETFKVYSNTGLPLELYKKLKEDLTFALAYLHDKKGVVHLDLSPDNIIVTPDKGIHLIDFESSKLIGTPLNIEDLRGKKEYLPPSLVEDRETIIIKKDFDLYALKIILSQAKKLLRKRDLAKLLLQNKFKQERIKTGFLLASPVLLWFLFFTLISFETSKGTSKNTHEKSVTRKNKARRQDEIKKDIVNVKQAAVSKKSPIHIKSDPSKERLNSEFEKIAEKRFLEAKECHILFAPTLKNISLAVTFKGTKVKKAKIKNPKGLDSEAQICFESLLSDIVLNEAPQEKFLIKSFRF